MALIKCPDCENGVSEHAKACPACGYPLEAMTIEQTSKPLKALLLLGAGLFVISIPAFFYGISQDSRFTPWGFGGMCGAMVWIISIKLFIWWRHG